MPSVPLPRRMWAGSRVRFLGPMVVGESYERHSSVQDVQAKQGASGELVFVTLHHAFSDRQGVVIDEEQDIVYRGPGAVASAPVAAKAAAQFTRTFKPESLLLFRYSALTFNAHRIHLDRSYATREESYAGLVVQAPLTATLLAELLHAQNPEARVDEVRFRAQAPLTDREPITLSGRLEGHDATLWAGPPAGGASLTMEVKLGRDVHA